MRNSGDYFHNEDNAKRVNDSHQGSLNSQKNEPRQHHSRPKNQISNMVIKPNGISGTYARIIPKKPVYDYEQLYSENMQLREKIKSLQDVVMKTKTRISMVEKEKDHILQQLRNQNFAMFEGKKPSNKLLQTHNNMKKRASTNDQNRRILHEYKDQIKMLEEENGRLKKTVKYTQIQQLQTQNSYLHAQMVRMKENMQDILNNTEYDQYEREIQNLQKQLNSEKQQVRSMHTRLKKKDEEIEEMKEKMRGIANRKTDLQRRYNREMNSLKGQLFRSKEKEKEFYQQQAILNEKKQSSKSFSAGRTCTKCVEHKKTIQNLLSVNKNYQRMIKEKNDNIAGLQTKINKIQEQKIQIQKSSIPVQESQKIKQNPPIITKKEEVQKQYAPAYQKTEQIRVNQPANNIQQQNLQKKSIQNQEKQESDSDYQEFDADELGIQGESQDKVDMLHVNLKKKTEQEVKKEDQYEEDFNELKEYEQEFKDNESEEEEVLFQKEQQKSKQSDQPKAAKKQKSKSKSKLKEKEKDKGKQKDSKGNSKAQKILHQTVKYRLIGQRYTYQDFQRDITESGATDFGIQDLIQMLTNEPFLLHEEHLQMVLQKCFGKKDFEQSDSLKTTKFMKSIKPLFEGVKLLGENQQKILTDGIKKKLRKKAQLIYEGMSTEGSNDEISKKGFMKILADLAKLNSEEIQQCLSEVSVVSKDIAHINYPVFMQTMLDQGQ